MEIFTQEDQDRIVQAVGLAESHTSGEIRLVVERKTKGSAALDRATYFFEKLDMHKTTLRNGVLVYLAVDDHQFAIIGDAGIHQKVSDSFWSTVREHMLAHFRQGNLADGLIAGIEEAGEQLGKYFPKGKDDVNELPDDIHFGEN